jgi:hypothetical protein
MVGKQNKSICVYCMTHCSELYQNRSQHPGSVQRMQASPSLSSLLCGGHAGWCTRLSSLEQTLSSRDHYRSLCLKTARCFTITLGTVHFIRVVSTKHTAVANEISWMPSFVQKYKDTFVLPWGLCQAFRPRRATNWSCLIQVDLTEVSSCINAKNVRLTGGRSEEIEDDFFLRELRNRRLVVPD